MSDEQKKPDDINKPAKDSGSRMSLSQGVPWKGIKPGWDPILGLETIRNTMAELISDIFFQPGKSPFDLPWQPAIDMYLYKNSLIVDISLPGCSKPHIKIHSTSDLLIIRGETPLPLETADENFFVRERRTGGFSRSIPLPFEVLPERIKAQFQEGLLRLTIPAKTHEPSDSVKVEIE